jgi:cbb3-type cytochrome c oxidase subunit III
MGSMELEGTRNTVARALLISTISLMVAAGAVGAEEVLNPFDKDPAAAAEGHDIFQKAGCPTCHGLEARGSTGPDLTDDEWRYKPTDEMIFRTITKGRKGTLMPAFEGKLAPDDIWKIIEFLRDSNRQRKARESQTQ